MWYSMPNAYAGYTTFLYKTTQNLKQTMNLQIIKLQNITQKIKDRVTWTPLTKTGVNSDVPEG